MFLAAILLVSLAFLMVNISPLGRVSPSAMLAASWGGVYTLQNIFAQDMVESIYATGVIFTITLAFAAGEMIGCTTVFIKYPLTSKKEDVNVIQKADTKEKKLRKTVIFFGVISLLGAFEYSRILGLFDVGSFSELILLPGVVRTRIFSEEIEVPYISRIGFLLSYSCVILSLYYYFMYKWRWYLALGIIAVLILAISQSGRAGLMVVILQLLITIYFKKVIIEKQIFLKIIASHMFYPLIILILIFFGGQLLREGFSSVTVDDSSRILYSLRPYLFGGISAFSSWIENAEINSTATLGRYSFSSLFASLGIYPQAPGIYDQYLIIASNGETSNIFTAYRSFIDDFTYLGACIFYFISGVISGKIGLKVNSGKFDYILIFIPVASWLVFSPLASLTYFNSFLVSCVLPFIVIRMYVNNAKIY